MSQERNTTAVPNDWERFAKEDPYTYILTGLKSSDRQDFWQSGYNTVCEEFLPLLRVQGVARRTAMEIGCGLGRLAFPLAAHFQTVVGVDVAPEMIERARRFACDNGVRNTEFFVISGPQDLINEREFDSKVDFVYSWLVFQHIPDLETIVEYLHATSLFLNKDGIALLQFDTRPASLAYRVKSNLPDFLLPRFWRRGIRRIRRSSAEIDEGMQKAGLRIVGELSPSTDLHRYVVSKTTGWPHRV
jgi:cyclopropane fatty-acyl-phospholipid synthase-like methyltransferase